MREYGQIQSAFWHSTDCEQMSDKAKLLACYLMTGPATNGIGCFRLTDGTVVDDLNWQTDDVESAFQELAKNGWAYRVNKVVFMPAFLRWNKIVNGNIAKARFGDWEQVPAGTIKCYAARAMLEFSDMWSDEHAERLMEHSQMVIANLSVGVTSEVENQNPTQTPPHQHPTTSNGNFELVPVQVHAKVNGKPRPNREVIPYDDIVELYHEILCPALPACVKITDTRKSQIRQRWHDLGSLDDWRAYFETVKKSPFLMGAVPGTNGRKTFRADIDFLVNAANMVKIIEGRYHQ